MRRAKAFRRERRRALKVAVQLGLLPGDSVLEKAQWGRDHGVEGIELGVWGGGLAKLRQDAEAIGGILPVSSVCGNADAEGSTWLLKNFTITSP